MEDKKLKKSLQLNTSFSKIRSRSISEVNSPRNESRNNDSFETDVSSRTKRKSLSINTDYKSSQKGGMLSQLSSHVKSYSFDTSLNNKGTLLSPISTVQESKEKDRLSFENTKALDNISSPIKASGVSGNLVESTNIN